MARRTPPSWFNRVVNAATSLVQQALAPKKKVFVYGTLKAGGANHKRMNGAKRVETHATLNNYHRIQRVGGPAIEPRQGDNVQGEVYEVDQETLSEVDQYEGPEFQRRRVRLEDGTIAYVYVPLK